MRYFGNAVAISLAILGTAVAAETLTPEAQAAKEQLAKRIGVDPDIASYKELVELNCKLMGADKEGEKARLLEGLGQPAAAAASGDEAVQLAAQLGVDPADYTLSQLVYIKGLVEGGNCTLERADAMIKAGETIGGSAAAAKGQLAMLLGVDPTDYTLNELVKMKWDAEGHSNSE